MFEKIDAENSLETIKDLVFKVAECTTRPEHDSPPYSFQGVQVISPETAEKKSSIFVEAHLEN